MAKIQSREESAAGNDIAYRIERHFGKARLIGWQFAADGRWDISERVFFDREPALMIAQVMAWLERQTSNDIAFEALFQLSGEDCFFFGVRITNLVKTAKASVMRYLLSACKKDDNLAAVISKTRENLASPLIMAQPESLELGVFDLWHKVGALTVWQQGDRPGRKSPLLRPEAFSPLLHEPEEGFARLDEPQPMPLMLEAVWKKNIKPWQDYQYWLSLPVSEQKEGRFILSQERYFIAADTLSGHHT